MQVWNKERSGENRISALGSPRRLVWMWLYMAQYGNVHCFVLNFHWMNPSQQVPLLLICQWEMMVASPKITDARKYLQDEIAFKDVKRSMGAIKTSRMQGSSMPHRPCDEGGRTKHHSEMDMWHHLCWAWYWNCCEGEAANSWVKHFFLSRALFSYYLS